MKNNIETELIKLFPALNEYYLTLQQNTKLIYRIVWNDFFNYLNIELSAIPKITKTDIMIYVSYIDKKYNNATFNLKIIALRNLFKQLEKNIEGFNSPFNNMSKIEKHLLNHPNCPVLNNYVYTGGLTLNNLNISFCFRVVSVIYFVLLSFIKIIFIFLNSNNSFFIE